MSVSNMAQASVATPPTCLHACTEQVLQEMLGTEGAKPGKNMLQHLGVLEQRLNELIEVHLSTFVPGQTPPPALHSAQSVTLSCPHLCVHLHGMQHVGPS